MNLRNHRRDVLKETLAEVGKRGKLSISTLSYAERGVYPSPYLIKQFAKAYRLSVGEIESMFAATSGGK